MTPEIGALFAGRYRVVDLLGQGAVGVVLGVRDETDGAARALKILNRPEATVEAARIVREGRALMKIESRYVVRIFDAGELAPWGPYLVLERLQGKNLALLSPLGQPWPWRQVLALAIHVCDALTAAHAIGIVHRDIKLSNLFLVEEAGESVVKVLDFGLAKDIGPTPVSRSTLTTGAIGSPQFMSPEQIAAPRSVDARTDLWSLGVVLHRLLSGQFPFHGESLGELSAKILRAPPPTLASRGIDAPPPLQAILDRCLAKELAARWSSAADLAWALYGLAQTA